MKELIYDFEVFCEDWLVVISDTDGKEIQVIHNDNQALKRVMLQHDVIFGGFNNKWYDDWIATYILLGAKPYEVKELNDWNIGGHEGWTFPRLQGTTREFKSFDLRDDLDMSLSLKAIEGNMNCPIVESSVDFTIDHKLSKIELDEVIYYCKTDVANTLKLYHLRKPYLDGKRAVAKLKGMDEAKALSMTNAKLTAMFLDAKLRNHDDEFEYIPPKELKLEKYTEPLEFYRKIDYSKTLVYEVAGLEQHYGWGGIHSAIENYIDASDEKHKIVDIDVGSYYPSLMIQYGYISRNIPSAEGYADVYHRRLDAKHNGRDEEAGALKLVLNTCYGALKTAKKDEQGNLLFGNPLYDPRQANHVCITGQLFLTDLVEKLEKVRGCKLIQTNTDGIMIKFPISQESKIHKVVEEWEHRTRMGMEYTDIHRIIQKDVNNYIAEQGATYLIRDGVRTETKADKHKIHSKGAYVKDWNGGTFANNSLVIVQRALVEYFVHDVPVEETINKATNIHDFQIIAKTGSTYKGTVWVVDGKDIKVQKVNRVYASSDARYGELFKVKDGRRDKVANVPPHSIVDNENKLKVDDIDKQFYIDLAKKRIDDYKGVKPPKKTRKRKGDESTMASATIVPAPQKLNLLQKLNLARLEFLQSNVKKSGVNRYAGYEYFELSDIIPVAQQLFVKYGLFLRPMFTDNRAFALVYDADLGLESTPIEFAFDTAKITIVSQQGKNKMNEAQGIGAEISYYTRYLYYLVLSIVECDYSDAVNGKPNKDTVKEDTKPIIQYTPIEEPQEKPKAPATKEERKEAVKEMTSGAITDTQKSSIVNGLKKLKKMNGDANYISGIVSRIKEHNSCKNTISIEEADAILMEIGNQIADIEREPFK